MAQNIIQLVGNTPLVDIRRLTSPDSGFVLAKLESRNPGGSLKDRIAMAMIGDAEARGKLAPGATIVEPTSGNTGIALAMIGAAKGYKVILTMPENSSRERVSLLSRYGAAVRLTPAEKGMAGAVAEAECLVEANPGYFMPQQFDNPANPEVHRRTTGPEILQATEGKIDAFVAGIGTGGTITGVGEILKREIPGVLIIGVEPARSPLISQGRAGLHGIQGIGANFIPRVLNRDILDEVITVEDEDAYTVQSRLAREEGLLVGPSAGANVTAALQVAHRLGKGKTVVTILPDTGERYLSMEADELLASVVPLARPVHRAKNAAAAAKGKN